jgi:hypothetical protein
MVVVETRRLTAKGNGEKEEEEFLTQILYASRLSFCATCKTHFIILKMTTQSNIW